MTASVISAGEIPPNIKPRIPSGTGPILGAYRSHAVLPDGVGESVDYQVCVQYEMPGGAAVRVRSCICNVRFSSALDVCL